MNNLLLSYEWDFFSENHDIKKIAKLLVFFFWFSVVPKGSECFKEDSDTGYNN